MESRVGSLRRLRARERRNHGVEQGSASVAPTPRRTVRRGIAFLVMIIMALGILLIWNGVLLTMREHERRPAVIVRLRRPA